MNENYSNITFSHEKDAWETPQDFFDRLNNIFGFDLDVCASEENHKCEMYFTKEQNGLAQDWSGHKCWCNPPYGRGIEHWVEKAAETVKDNKTVVVCLLPARTDTKWFHTYVLNNERAHVKFVRGRMRFSGSKQRATFPSMIVVFA